MISNLPSAAVFKTAISFSELEPTPDPSLSYSGEEIAQGAVVQDNEGHQPDNKQLVQGLTNQELISQLTDQLPDGTETFIHKTAEDIVDQLLADQSIDFESLTRSAIQDEYKDLPVEQTESMLTVILLEASESLDTGRSDEIYLQPDSDNGSDDNGEQNQLAMLNLQDEMNKQAQLIQMMSYIQKMINDTAEDIIRNMK